MQANEHYSFLPTINGISRKISMLLDQQGVRKPLVDLHYLQRQSAKSLSLKAEQQQLSLSNCSFRPSLTPSGKRASSKVMAQLSVRQLPKSVGKSYQASQAPSRHSKAETRQFLARQNTSLKRKNQFVKRFKEEQEMKLVRQSNQSKELLLQRRKAYQRRQSAKTSAQWPQQVKVMQYLSGQAFPKQDWPMSHDIDQRPPAKQLNNQDKKQRKARQQQLIKKSASIFKQLSSKKNGKISFSSIDLKRLRPSQIESLFPVLLQMKSSQRQCSLAEFTELLRKHGQDL